MLQCLWLGSLFFPIDVSKNETETELEVLKNADDATNRPKSATDMDHSANDISLKTNNAQTHLDAIETNTDNQHSVQDHDAHRSERTNNERDKAAGTPCCWCSWQPLSNAQRLWNCAMLKNKAFLVYIGVLFMTELTINLFYKFSGIRALEKGITKQQAALIPSAIAMTSTCARIVMAIVANLPKVSVCFTVNTHIMPFLTHTFSNVNTKTMLFT